MTLHLGPNGEKLLRNLRVIEIDDPITGREWVVYATLPGGYDAYCPFPTRVLAEQHMHGLRVQARARQARSG